MGLYLTPSSAAVVFRAMEDVVLAPSPWMILPFGLLLACIALAPLFFGDWWGKHYPKVALGLGAVTLCYYFIGFHGAEALVARHHETR